MSASSESKTFRITSAGHVLFALSLIWLGVLGLQKGDFTVVWNPVPKWVPVREALAYIVASISLASGLGLLFQRTAAIASRLIVVTLAIWVLVLRVPPLFYQKPLVLVAWSFGATAAMLAAAWMLYVRLAGERDRHRLGFVATDKGMRVASVLFGLSLVPFGLAHFMYVDATIVLIPKWLPFHVALAYFTGAAFVSAGLGVALGVLPRMAALLSAKQMGLFGLIVWVPRVITGNVTEFQFGEFVVTCALTAAALVIFESYHGTRFFGSGQRPRT